MIERDLAPKLREAAKAFPAVTVTGPRQSGKSTLCRRTFPKHAYANLEAPDVRAFAQEDPRAFLGQFQGGAIIDHVGGAAPILATGLGGKLVVRFDGNGYLYGSHDFDPGTLTAHTIFLLARWTDADLKHCYRILSSQTWNWAFGHI